MLYILRIIEVYFYQLLDVIVSVLSICVGMFYITTGLLLSYTNYFTNICYMIWQKNTHRKQLRYYVSTFIRSLQPLRAFVQNSQINKTN